jgi:hypothetical protein
MFATDLMRHVGELSDVTTAQVGESKSEYQRASDALAPFKRTLDIYTGQWFRNGATKKTRRGAKEQVESAEAAFLAGPRADRVLNANGRGLADVLDGLNREEREVVRNALERPRRKDASSTGSWSSPRFSLVHAPEPKRPSNALKTAASTRWSETRPMMSCLTRSSDMTFQ